MNAPSVHIPAARREREKQERRAAIMAAAEQVIIDRGFAAASIDGIARAAGLAAGTVYLYFPNREALFQELLCSKVRLLNASVAAGMTGGRAFPETLKAVVQAMLRHFEEHRGFFEIFVRERLEIARGESRTEGVFAEMEAGTGVMALWLRESQRAGLLGAGDPRMMAVALRGLVFQFTRDWLRSGTKGRLTKFAPFITEFFMKGAGA